jgi:hypothetical protein
MYVLLIVVCPFVLFLLAIVLSVLLRYMDSDYPFGIFKLFNNISKTKDPVTQTPLKTGDELRCSGRVSSSYSTSGTRRVNLVTNLVIYIVYLYHIWPRWLWYILFVSFYDLTIRYCSCSDSVIYFVCLFLRFDYWIL